jgi:hypothetical protein
MNKNHLLLFLAPVIFSFKSYSQIVPPGVDSCFLIDKKIDEFTGEIKFTTPEYDRYGIAPMVIQKYVNKGKITYYLSLTTYGNTVNVNEKGVFVLFTDGTKWSRNSKVDVDVTDDAKFRSSAFIALTPADVTMFGLKKVKEFRLYIYDEPIFSEDAEQFMTYLKCVKKAK